LINDNPVGIEPFVSRNDQWFDQSLYAKGDALKKLIRSVAGYMQHHPDERGRQRARKLNDRRTFEACIEAVTVNLAYLTVRPSETGRLALPRGTGTKRDRYDNPLLAIRTLNTVVDRLNGLVLDLTIGQRRLNTSSIAPTEWFKRRVHEAGVSIEDFGRDEHQEVIILNKTTRSEGWTEEGTWEPQRSVERKDYTDTSTTEAFRAQVRRLNAFLEAADIVFVDDSLLPAVDPLRRRLFRYFSVTDDEERFDKGGRLFGGFWINLKKARRGNIRINGEPIADLDYKNMFARLAYARVGHEPLEGDLYDLTGLLEGYDRTNEDHRDGVKQSFNSLLNGGRAGSRDLYDLLPEGSTPKKVREAVRAKHPALAPILETTVGMNLMFTESEVLLRVLERLMEQGIVALPIHDGLMVAQSHAEAAGKVMKSIAQEMVGIPMPVVVKGS
jgi:hypothetical protein